MTVLHVEKASKQVIKLLDPIVVTLFIALKLIAVKKSKLCIILKINKIYIFISSFCRQCNKDFHVHTNSPIVTLRCTNEKYENIVGDEEIMQEKWITSRVKEFFKGNTCDERNSYYLEKLEEQRKINLEIMKKMNLLTNNYKSLVKLISEQTQSFKVVVGELT